MRQSKPRLYMDLGYPPKKKKPDGEARFRERRQRCGYIAIQRGWLGD